MRNTMQRAALRLVELASADPDRAVGLLCIVILAVLPLVLDLQGVAL